MSIAAVLLGGACAAAAQSPGFWLIGYPAGGEDSSARGLSQNGSVATGFVTVQPVHPGAGYRWTRAGGREDWGLLPGMPDYTSGRGLSSAGDTIVGWMGTWEDRRAYRRIGSGPLQDLGLLPGETDSHAEGVSGDGTIVVGSAFHPSANGAGQAFRWSEATGMQGLGYLRPGSSLSEGNAISRDGSTIVGTSRAFDYEAFRWTQSGGIEALPGLPGSQGIESFAYGVNADGTIAVGSAKSATPQGHAHAVRWTGGGVQDLGTLGTGQTSYAYSVSDDGNVIGGTAAGQLAFIWTPATSMRSLTEYLLMHGVSAPVDYRLEVVYAISGDGLTFAGEARHLITNQREGFVATVPSPATAIVLLVVPVGCWRRRRA